MADLNADDFSLLLFVAERFSDFAISNELFNVKTLGSKSMALLLRVTFALQRLVDMYIILKQIKKN